MSIKQLNGTYLATDDRIIFRFTTIDNSEYKFWLTRRITHLILKAANKFFVKQQEERHQTEPAIAKAISDFQQQAVADTTDLTETFMPGQKFPLGAETLLLIDARCEMIHIENQDIFSLDFVLPGGANLNLKLPISSMRGLVMLLEQINRQAQWGEPENNPLH